MDETEDALIAVAAHIFERVGYSNQLTDFSVDLPIYGSRTAARHANEARRMDEGTLRPCQ
jgi:hypothetical protein